MTYNQVQCTVFSWQEMNTEYNWWPPCWWLPTTSATLHWAAIFQCKTRGQRGESAAKPRAMLCQSALKRSERSLRGCWSPLTGNEQTLSTERRRRLEGEEVGGQVTVIGGGGSEHVAFNHMTHWRREESRAAILWLKCNNAQSWSCSWIHSFEYKSVYTAADAGESSLVASAQRQFTQ